MGVKERDVKREAMRVATSTKPSCLKMIPASPVRNIRGRKITTVVMVEAVMAMPISLVPKTAAVVTRPPCSTCRVMFSSTTIPLSTTMPEAMARDMRDMRLMV